MNALELKKNELTDEIAPFENKLGRLLSPRRANPEFVQNLKHKLLTEPAITVEIRRKYLAFWVIAAGLFAGALTLFLVSRNQNKQLDLE
jgi:hypothetical protein